jgi:hypothetical protein
MRTVLLLGISCTLVACSLERPPPTVIAARMTPRCADVADGSAAKVAAPANVRRVQPLYSVLNANPNGAESRLVGAKLELRPLDGVTPEALGLALQCREAKETSSDEADDRCPYAIPGMWVDIDVKSNGAGYEVDLRGEDFDEATLILQRANGFASAR